ncbi:LysR family transcriptional regulator [Jiangella asiatica]|uniref:LysR family transcriptional regulator n=1 Tax=Jiangella asiatica TaxID=2530372 RepID=A0A4R5DDT3_9ACTN|nr:LysR family transcriptional regulator [Jiangella asiatica]TDE11227.1 LysR family transcriptional regulator [Jiangella asiatica]
MQLRQLEIISVLADELHFSRAAQRLGISQSALSQQLHKFETELGVRLVTRTSREISLTEVGEQVLEAARQTLAAVDRTRVIVDDHLAGRTGRMVIGSLGAGLNGPLPGILRKFRQVSPRSVIELIHSRDSATQERGILSGELDAAVVRRVANIRSLETTKILDESFVVYLPDDHRLAARTTISLGELFDESYVFWHRHLGSSFYDLLIDGCRAQGFEPRIEALGDTLEAQLALVAAGIGISIQAASMASIARSGTVAIPLDPADLRAGLWFAYRRWNRSALVENFLSVAKDVVG